MRAAGVDYALPLDRRELQPSHLAWLRRRLPDLGLVVARYTELAGVQDPALLVWAAERNRILVTHDFKTIPKHAYERVKAGQPMPGVIAVPKTPSIRQAIEELMMVIVCCEASELENQVMYLPLSEVSSGAVLAI